MATKDVHRAVLGTQRSPGWWLSAVRVLCSTVQLGPSSSLHCPAWKIGFCVQPIPIVTAAKIRWALWIQGDRVMCDSETELLLGGGKLGQLGTAQLVLFAELNPLFLFFFFLEKSLCIESEWSNPGSGSVFLTCTQE